METHGVKKMEQRDFIRELDMARTEASMAVCDIKTLVMLCDHVVADNGGHPEEVEGVDWVSVFNLLRLAVAEGERHIDQLEQIIIEIRKGGLK